MEIAPVPHRSSRSEWRRLALGLTVLVPVLLLVLLPAVLGLERFVVTDGSTDGSPGRGSVVLAREVPSSDLRVHDVITFRPPGGSSDDRVSRHVLAIKGGVATTRADRAGTRDRWAVPPTSSAYARVWLGIPWIGYPFVMDGGWMVLALVALAALVLALVTGRRHPPTVVRANPARMPVG